MPLAMEKGSSRSPLSQIWMRLVSCSWSTICEKLRTVKSFHDDPLSSPAHSVKSCSEVDKSCIKSIDVFSALLELTEDKHHVRRAFEFTLAPEEDFFDNSRYEPLKNLPSSLLICSEFDIFIECLLFLCVCPRMSANILRMADFRFLQDIRVG